MLGLSRCYPWILVLLVELICCWIGCLLLKLWLFDVSLFFDFVRLLLLVDMSLLFFVCDVVCPGAFPALLQVSRFRLGTVKAHPELLLSDG